MALFPPIPPFPQLPFPVPFNLTIPPSHILTLPDPEDEFCVCCVNHYLDCLITQCFAREGLDWIISLNRKMYLIKWRDVAPRGPWTRQVWDVFRLLPDDCGCPSVPISMGWEWCWADIINMLREVDEIAYIRFASVYKQFRDVEEFKEEFEKLFTSKKTL